jgi:ABC-2 type transport system ATP-binding protein
MEQSIRAEKICKRYRDLTALDNVYLEAHAGECLGVFGVSGAGKSVLLRILAGLEVPDSGDVLAADRRAGFASQSPALDALLTPAETLWLHACLCDIPRRKRWSAVRETLSLLGLDSERNRRIGTLPDGDLKLLELGTALICPADVLLLDEPMACLDSGTRHRLWERLLSLRASGRKAIVMSTSRTEDAELCDRVILLHRGRVVAEGTVSELRNTVGPEALVVRQRKSPRRGPGVVGKEEDGSLTFEFGAEAQPVELVKQIGSDAAGVVIRPRGLDSVLDELTAPEKR